MNYTADEVMEYISEEDVKFVRMAFCDVYGKQRNVAIMAGELPRAFDHGIAIDASAVPGFDMDVRSDLFLRPNAETLKELPWRPQHGRVAHMFCDIIHPDGSPFSADTRRLLRGAVEAAAERGLEPWLEHMERSVEMRLNTFLYVVREGTAQEAVAATGKEGEGVVALLTSLEKDVQLMNESHVFTCGEVAERLAEEGCALAAAISLVEQEDILAELMASRPAPDPNGPHPSPFPRSCRGECGECPGNVSARPEVPLTKPCFYAILERYV